jgi:glyoxylase-like metal-dependent hydrolase (beta-lactamase superfamily II)
LTPPIVNVGYLSTNYWVLGAGPSRLLIDLGYPGTMGTLLANLRRMDVPLADIRYAIATHYHIDHAGLGQELKDRGVSLLVLESQLAAIPVMKRWTKPRDHYTDIALHDNVVLPFADSRPRLAEIALEGEILATPGHSDDSVSVLLDSGAVFTGDLTPPPQLGDDVASGVARRSWRLLRERGAIRVYPGHGPVYSLADAIGDWDD